MKYAPLVLIAFLAVSQAFTIEFEWPKAPNAEDTIAAEAIGQPPSNSQRPVPSRPVPPTFNRPVPPQAIAPPQEEIVEEEVQGPSRPHISLHRPVPPPQEEIIEEEVQRPSRPHIHRPVAPLPEDVVEEEVVPPQNVIVVPPPTSDGKPEHNRPSFGSAIVDFFRPQPTEVEPPHFTNAPQPTPETVNNEESKPKHPVSQHIPHHNGNIVQPIAPVETTVADVVVPTPKYSNGPTPHRLIVKNH